MTRQRLVHARGNSNDGVSFIEIFVLAGASLIPVDQIIFRIGLGYQGAPLYEF